MEEMINLRKKREFGEIFNVIFLFIKQEYKKLGMVILYYVLPALILTSIFNSLNQWSLMKNVRQMGFLNSTEMISTFWTKYLVIYLLMAINQVIVMAVIYAYLKCYLEKGKDGFNHRDIFEVVKSRFIPLLLAGLLMFLMIVAGTFLCVLPGIYLWISLSLVGSVIIFENKGTRDAISRSFNLVHIQWWWTFLLVFVTMIIVTIIAYLITLPASIGTIGTIMHSIKNPEEALESITSVSIIYSVISTLVVNILYVIPLIALALQYFNLVEIKENRTLLEKIQQVTDEPKQD